MLAKASERLGLYLLDKNSRLFLFGFLVSQLCGDLFKFCFAVFLLFNNKSLILFSGYISIEYILNAILGPKIGSVCDSFSRKSLMIYMDISRGILMIFCVLLLQNSNKYLFLIIFLISFVDQVLYLIFYYASIGLVKELSRNEKELVTLNTNIALIKKISTAFGSLIGAIFTKIENFIIIIMLLNSFSFTVSAFFETKIKIVKRIELERKKLSRSLVQTFQMFKNNKLLLFLVILLIHINALYVLTLDVFVTYRLTVTNNIFILSYIKVIIILSGILGSLYLNKKKKDIKNFSFVFLLYFIMIALNFVLIYKLNVFSIIVIFILTFIIGFLMIETSVVTTSYILNLCNYDNVSGSFAIIQTILTGLVPFFSILGAYLVEKIIMIYVFVLVISCALIINIRNKIKCLNQ